MNRNINEFMNLGVETNNPETRLNYIEKIFGEAESEILTSLNFNSLSLYKTSTDYLNLYSINGINLKLNSTINNISSFLKLFSKKN